MSVSIYFARGIATVTDKVWTHEDPSTAKLLNSLNYYRRMEWLEEHVREEAYGDAQLAELMAKALDGKVL